ncbi:glycosyltransferase [Streptomyces pseudogriseolus]|uniref:glycosyltransferase n=1 Tax=Streptomyces pseudogriseolus TaxID=36817 RepID=UPI003FA1AD5F
MRILLWHVHGSWTTAFVQGPHTYVVPVTPDRGPDGLGRARTFDWPDSVVEVPPERLAEQDVDVVVLQRPHEIGLVDRWLRRRPPLVYLEHNAPHGHVPDTRHPAADIPGVTLVHVTHFNRLMWDAGATPTTVIEHGIVDPGPLWTGELPHAAVVVNEPVRRGRTTGTDLLSAFAAAAPLDVFGMGTDGLAGHLGLPAGRCRTHELTQARLHAEMARRRVYVHPVRWTSLGLSLLEAMHLGMPVVALATTEVTEAVPPGAGVVSNRIDVLTDAVREFTADPLSARRTGELARAAALARYGLPRFLDDWERLLKEVTR